MTFEHPVPEQIRQLLQLWKDVFGDWNGFWETFLETGFSPERCRCITEGGQVAAALTWMDVTCRDQKMAYIYAVVTHPGYRGKGLCRQLMADTHSLLREQGYAAALLVPAEESLRRMYEGFGYRTCTHVGEFDCEAAVSPVALRALGPEEFVRLRKEFLPEAAVIQEGENLAFLSRQAQFYTGDGFLLAAYGDEESITGMELLGQKETAPGIVRALGAKKGSFRCPGEEIPFAMMYPFVEDAVSPRYFGFAFD